jgi:hypothetical protein
MNKGKLSHPRSKALSLLLAGWMAFLVVAAAGHTHEALGSAELQPALTMSAGPSSPSGGCLICLAAHTSAPEAVAPSLAGVPQDLRGTWQVEPDLQVGLEVHPTRSSRAPPAQA